MEEVKRLEMIYKRNPTKENERQYKKALVQLYKNTLNFDFNTVCEFQ